METWRDIEGYEGRYQVSDHGNVRSLDYRRTGKPRNLLQFDTGGGYYCVALYRNRKRKEYKVHRLVALAFCKNARPGEFTLVNHKDENPANNRADNLEWCDNLYNINYGTRNSRISASLTKSEVHKANTMKQSKGVRCVETGETFYSVREAERRLGIQRISIIKQCRGEISITHGLHFEYA